MTFIQRAFLSSLLWASFHCEAKILIDADETDTKEDHAATAYLKQQESRFIYGPTTVKLADQGELALKYGQAFVPPEILAEYLRIANRGPWNGVLGMTIPGLPGDAVPAEDWGAIFLMFKEDGFIKNDEARAWQSRPLFDKMKKGFEARNEEKRKKGQAEAELLRWAEEPEYDTSTHRLQFAVVIKTKGNPDTESTIYANFSLGRQGFLTYAYSPPVKNPGQFSHIPKQIHSQISFVPGKRYEDFVPGEDKVAQIGLTALVTGGVVAMHMGWFAKSLPWLKGFAVFGLVAAWLWKKRKK